jgi:hypothetical protein
MSRAQMQVYRRYTSNVVAAYPRILLKYHLHARYTPIRIIYLSGVVREDRRVAKTGWLAGRRMRVMSHEASGSTR